jgi:hypothetical protein
MIESYRPPRGSAILAYHLGKSLVISIRHGEIFHRYRLTKASRKRLARLGDCWRVPTYIVFRCGLVVSLHK